MLTGPEDDISYENRTRGGLQCPENWLMLRLQGAGTGGGCSPGFHCQARRKGCRGKNFGCMGSGDSGLVRIPPVRAGGEAGHRGWMRSPAAFLGGHPCDRMRRGKRARVQQRVKKSPGGQRIFVMGEAENVNSYLLELFTIYKDFPYD